jgi:hypothetical protein
VAELSDDQQAEYAKAFGPEPTPDLVRKYLFVRLQSILETAILHESEFYFEALEREARLLADLGGDSAKQYGLLVADTVRFLAKLKPDDRAERLACLRALHELSANGRVLGTGVSWSDRSVRLTGDYCEFVRCSIISLHTAAKRYQDALVSGSEPRARLK